MKVGDKVSLSPKILEEHPYHIISNPSGVLGVIERFDSHTSDRYIWVTWPSGFMNVYYPNELQRIN